MLLLSFLLASPSFHLSLNPPLFLSIRPASFPLSTLLPFSLFTLLLFLSSSHPSYLPSSHLTPHPSSLKLFLISSPHFPSSRPPLLLPSFSLLPSPPALAQPTPWTRSKGVEGKNICAVVVVAEVIFAGRFLARWKGRANDLSHCTSRLLDAFLRVWVAGLRVCLWLREGEGGGNE